MRRGTAGRSAAGIAAACVAAAPVSGAERAAEVERTTPPVVVETTRLPELAEDPTAFTRVIDVEAYAGEDKRVEDLLEPTPGVHVRRFGGPGGPSEVSIRGSTGAQVVVLLDGVRLNSAQSGTVDLGTIPKELIERIEVSRGGGSVQTGSDAIGGVVNVVTRRASAKPTTTASFAFGSFETYEGSVSQAGRVGDVEVLLGYDGFKTSGDWEFEPVSGPNPDSGDTVRRINNRSERHSVLAKLGAELGERVRVDLSDSVFHGSEGRPGLDLPSGGADRGQRRRAHLRRTRNALQLHLRGVELTSRELDADLRLFHRYERVHFRDPDLAPPADVEDVNTAFGARGGVEGTWTLGPTAQRWSLSTELRSDRLSQEDGPGRERDVVGVWVQDDLSLWDERIRLVSAVRFDETEDVGSEWLPRIGLVVEPRGWLRLRANAERSYRVPNFDELYFQAGEIRGNPALEPEDALNFDLGAELAFGGAGPIDGFSLEVAGFHNDVDNTIVFQQVSPNVIQATNVPDVRITGVELSGRVVAGPATLSGSWTWLDTELRSNGNPLPGRPESEADLRLELAPWDGAVKLVGSMLRTDEIPLDEGGRAWLSGRTTFDASLVVDVARWRPLREALGLDALLLSVVATNVTDRAVRDALGFPQPGRVLSFRIEGRR